MTAKNVTKKQAKMIEQEMEVSFMFVEEDGYKATFHDTDQKALVNHLLNKVEGFGKMICTLQKAISLIERK